MASIGVLLCLLGLVVFSNCKCSFEELVWDNNPPTGCVDEAGAEHEFGSEWVKDCMECSCSIEGLSCCSKMLDENVDIPEDCELVLDKENCSAKMVLKSNKAIECTPV